MKRINSLIGGLVIAASIWACSQQAVVPNQRIDQMVASAKTASDHEAIAEYYEREAAEAEAKYEEHEASAVHYDEVAKWRTWAWHCAGLVQDFKDVKEQASALAAEHRKIAAEMKSGQTPPRASTATQ